MRRQESSTVMQRSWSRHRVKGVVFILLVTVTLLSCSKGGQETTGQGNGAGRSAPIPVRVTAATLGAIHVYLSGLGTVTPLETVIVRSRVDGALQSVHFTEGQMVKAGDLLAQIDPRPYQVQLEQAQGQLARDRALLESARKNLKRYRTLLAQDSIAEQQVTDQESLVGQYEGSVKLDQAQVDDARLHLDYARITAPVSGRLGLRLVDRGNIIHASDPGGLVKITRIQPISVLFTIPQDDLPDVLGHADTDRRLPVEAWSRDATTRLASGELVAVDNEIDPASGTVKLRAQFANRDDRLYPNQFVNVRLLVRTLQDAVTIPASAIQHGTQGRFVYVVQPEHTVALRVVQVGPVEDGRSAIVAGLAAGEQVVTDGIDRLHDGAAVRLPGPPADQADGAAERAAGPQQRH
jgi:multidrug efflux system membrane fusion protein